ncbi:MULTISPECIES: DUF7261 family protein [Halorussus]|uniref:DUF7261 family protein n=1 Tax=Halorussus TaxID=1070314 RepID=UPI00209E1595|nr:hypothetical protein [Halorussus vallis]USZ75546.1 hypothetical protein NGM07_19205 [Halorussus vallis]
MADVTPDGRGRGQLILVGGLSLAVVFVALALVVNSAIYTENLATRTGDASVDDAVGFRHDALAGAGTAIDHANRNGGDRTYSSRYDEYKTALRRWQTLRANYSAVDGLLTSVTPSSGREGTLVADRTSGEFTPVGGQHDWVVAPDVEARQFRLTVRRSGLPSLDDATVEDTLTTSDDAAFFVELDDGNDVWRVAIYRDSTTDKVEVMSYDADGTIRTCAADGSSVVVDLTAGTLDGVHCEALDFPARPTGTYDVRYINADAVVGTYELTVDRVEGPFRHEVDAANGVVCPPTETTYRDDPDLGSPYTTPAIYSATVDLVVDGPSLTYETDGRVAPGESGRPAVAPYVTKFEITDDDDDGSFAISWSVSDPDGNLDTVDVTVTNQNTGTSQTYAATSGSETVDFGSTGDRFTVAITATDADGNDRTASKEHVVDGTRCPP